jgi:hypothetical protein
MFILRIKKLRQELADQGLSEKQALFYYLATAILSALTYEAVANSPGSGGAMVPVDYLDGGLDMVFTIGGIIWCYAQNGGKEGKEFLNRIVPIGWVMFWRLMLGGLIPFTILVGVLNWNATGSFGRPESESVLEVIIHNGLFLGMFWRMGVHMKWVANNKS